MGLAPRPLLLHLSTLLILILATSATRAQTINTSTPGACATTGSACVWTYHNDNARDGVNSNETALTPLTFPTPTSANFGLLTSSGATGAVDGLIYGQPLYLSGVSMASSSSCGGTQNIVLVATENNSVYAFAVAYNLTGSGYTFSLTQCWMLNFNNSGEYAIPFTALPQDLGGFPCNNIVPESGITSTPVIDTTVTPPVMYVVSAHQLASNSAYTYRLHAILTNTGAEVQNGSAPFDLSSVFTSPVTAATENQRPGLAMSRTTTTKAYIYVGFGSYCDLGAYSGYVAGLSFTYSDKTFAKITSSNWFFDTQGGSTSQNGGVWMGGAAPAVDSSGNVYVAVANGNWNGTSLFGESAVKIASTPSGLVAVDYYTPNDYADLNTDDISNVTLCSTYGPTSCPTANLLTLVAPTGDFDLGSGGITLISPVGVTSPVCGSNPELVAGGKEGVLYGICHGTQTGSTLQSLMGGLDGCGYGCSSTTSNPTLTACSESSTPGNGYIAQCFQGVNAGELANGSGTILAAPGIRGTEAFWAGPYSPPNPTYNYLYVGGSGAAMAAYQANPTTGSFVILGDQETVPKTFPYPGTVPAVSWDGSTAASALLWAIDAGGYGAWNASTQKAKSATSAILVAYQAVPQTTLGVTTLKELWESDSSSSNFGPGAVKFSVPTIANGLVFVPGGTQGYAPGPPTTGTNNVNCTAAYLAIGNSTPICGGMLNVYGKLKSGS